MSKVDSNMAVINNIPSKMVELFGDFFKLIIIDNQNVLIFFGYDFLPCGGSSGKSGSPPFVIQRLVCQSKSILRYRNKHSQH